MQTRGRYRRCAFIGGGHTRLLLPCRWIKVVRLPLASAFAKRASSCKHRPQNQNTAQKRGVCVAGETMNKPLTGVTRRKLRSSEWFNNPHNPGMTALYLERYLNYGLTRKELQSGAPIIGIAQTGNDLSP